MVAAPSRIFSILRGNCHVLREPLASHDALFIGKDDDSHRARTPLAIDDEVADHTFGFFFFRRYCIILSFDFSFGDLKNNCCFFRRIIVVPFVS
jgi:hypothetical protein